MRNVGLEYYVHQSDDAGIRAPIGSQWIVLDFPYDPRLVDSLKVQFGWEARRWSPEKKLWYVWRDLEDRLIKILKDLRYGIVWTKPERKKTTTAKSGPSIFDRETVFDAFRRNKAKASTTKPAEARAPFSSVPPPRPATPRPAGSTPLPRPPALTPKAPTDYDLLEILPTARFEVAKAAYRALCMVHHPDQGGNEVKMTALNAAWDRLCKKYGRTT